MSRSRFGPMRRGFKEELSPTTENGYAERVALFQKWCGQDDVRLDPATAVAVLAFLADHSQLVVGTQRNVVSAVNRRCHDEGRPIPGHDPQVRATLAGASSGQDGREVHRAYPLLLEQIELTLAGLAEPSHVRDRALTARGRAALLVGREAGIALLDLARSRRDDLILEAGGAELSCRDRKGRVSGVARFRRIGGPFDAVAALEELLAVLPAASEHLFGFAEMQRLGPAALVPEERPKVIADALRAQLRAAARRCRWDVGSIEPLWQLSEEKVAALCGGLEHDLLLRHRDAALIASGWFLARRPVALSSIYLDEMEDLGDDGFRLFVRHDKTAPNGYWITCPHTQAHGLVCPACRLRDLLDVLGSQGISTGPLFSTIRSDHWNGTPMSRGDISVAVQRSTALVGLVHTGISGRSLRRGMATELYRRGVSEAERMEVLGHADRRTAVLYVDRRVLG